MNSPMELRVILTDWEGETREAYYKHFQIGNPDEKYILTIGNYSGDAGDSLKFHNGAKFTTMDQNNEDLPFNCGEHYKSGWWFKSCYQWFVSKIIHLMRNVYKTIYFFIIFFIFLVI